jgi:hypothetical protein
VRAALVGRQRQPNVAVELPIVVCTQLEATEDVQRQLLDMLKHITGTSEPLPAVRPFSLYHARHSILTNGGTWKQTNPVYLSLCNATDWCRGCRVGRQQGECAHQAHHQRQPHTAQPFRHQQCRAR